MVLLMLGTEIYLEESRWECTVSISWHPHQHQQDEEWTEEDYKGRNEKYFNGKKVEQQEWNVWQS